LRPVAAADYFLRNPLIAWFSLNVIGIIPIGRSGSANKNDIFSTCHEALDNGDIIILFPEGTRGIPEQSSKLKKGIYYLVKDRNSTPIIPVVTHGLGRALPRGEALLVPFNCDVVVGDAIQITETSAELLNTLTETYAHLLQTCLTYNKIE
jgi:1-acyl-sn-glycerol-3-phosphate acyltransferase